MDKTETTLRRFLAALPAPGCDIGILSDQGMYRLESVAATRTLRMLPYFKYRNANGANIYIRPTGESPYTLLDDLTASALPVSPPRATAPPLWSRQAPAASRHGLDTSSRFPKSLERIAARLSFNSRPSRYATPAELSRFRTSPRCADRPAAADMAFCVAACSQGWSESATVAAMSAQYLSRDTNISRQAACIRRKISKAIHWAA